MFFFLFSLHIFLINSPNAAPSPWKKPLTHSQNPTLTKYFKETPGYWKGFKDELILQHIQKSEIVKIGFNMGGSTISLRLYFKDGSNAAFKPEQYHEETVPRYEIAAYRINKLLGLSRVPPATWRIITKKELFAKLSEKVTISQRKRILREVKFTKNGTIRGQVSHWIPVIKNIALEAKEWRKKWLTWLAPFDYLYEQEYILAGQIGKMIIFDFIINNPDRFTGNNTMADRSKKYLYFMDNTFAFYPNPIGSSMAKFYMLRIKRYSLQMIENLQKLNKTLINKELAKEKHCPWKILTNKEIDALLKRRDFLMLTIVKNIAHYGWSKTVIFP